VIKLIRGSKAPEDAKAGLIKNFKLSEIQAQAILDMRLQRLTQLESLKVKTEHKELMEKIKDYKDILAKKSRVFSIISSETKEIREKYPDVIILAGNVVTKEGVSSIINAGADIVKGGIANGGFCETKLKAGVGYKQFSMIRECSPLANEMGALFCSDGGCKTPADICKALGGGSNFVMVGSLFAGYDQCDSEWTTVDGQKKMLMYGMSSKIANDKYCGGLQSYRTSEGREGWVDYKGDVKELATDIKGSVASCCTYTDTKNLQDLRKNCVFTA
jgi:GMP reductase